MKRSCCFSWQRPAGCRKWHKLHSPLNKLEIFFLIIIIKLHITYTNLYRNEIGMSTASSWRVKTLGQCAISSKAPLQTHKNRLLITWLFELGATLRLSNESLTYIILRWLILSNLITKREKVSWLFRHWVRTSILLFNSVIISVL